MQQHATPRRLRGALNFDNPADPNRPLQVRATADGIEIRIGAMGITDAVATLDAAQARSLADWMGEATR